MTHLDEGTILALRDGALVTGDAREHIASCGRCAGALGEAGRRADAVAQALATIDRPVDVEAAKARVRARLDRAPERNPVRTLGVGHLGRAAAILLLAAGAVTAALPGSPVRDWLRPTPDATTVPPEAVAAIAQEAHEGGIVVSVPDGRIDVVLTGVQAGSRLDVVWRDAATARISAAAGSSFSYAEGRAEARVSAGPVRVELPRYAPVVSISVDGRTYLRRSSSGLELLAPVVEQSDDLIRFVVRER